MFVLIFLILIFFIFIGGIVTFLFFGKENKYELGVVNYNEGNYGAAKEAFSAYLIRKGYDPKPRFYLAKIALEDEEPLIALKHCISITVNRYATLKEKADAYAFMANIYREQEQSGKATKMAIEGFKLDPKNPSIHYQLGQIYVETDKYHNAVKEFNLVLSADRTHVPARLALAELHYNNKDEVKAIFQYKRILELDPNNVESSFNLAKIYYNNGDLVTSTKELEKIKEPSKELEMEYYFMLSNYYLKQNELERARELMEKVAYEPYGKSDKQLEIQYNLANIYFLRDEVEKADELYKIIKDENPRYKDIDIKLQKTRKILNPKEYQQMIDEVDYNALGAGEFEDLYYNLIHKIGYKEVKLEIRRRNEMTSIASERFKSILQGKYILSMIRALEPVGRDAIMKFKNILEENQAVRGILISTSTFTDSAISYAEEQDNANIDLMDKVNIFEMLGN